MKLKSKWKSKTMWFNWVMSVIVTIAGGIQMYLPEMGFDPSWTGRIMFVLFLIVTFGNKYLRTLTVEELE